MRLRLVLHLRRYRRRTELLRSGCSTLLSFLVPSTCSCWYTRKELALRTAVLYPGLVLATAFSGLLAAGIFSGLDGKRGVEGWRRLFIIEGAGSFAMAALALFIFLGFPESTTSPAKWLLTTDKRALATERIARDRISDKESDRSVRYELKLAARDFRTWVSALMLRGNHTASGFNSFYPPIVQGFRLGSDTVTTWSARYSRSSPPTLATAAASATFTSPSPCSSPSSASPSPSAR